ncbi:MAG: MFS transporter, partial [Pseudomonadota bacterium]
MSNSPELSGAGAETVPPRLAVSGTVAAYIAFVTELTLVPLLLPTIQMQFGLSIGALAWVFNAYGIAVAMGVLLGGWLGDNFNVHRVFASGVALFAAGSLVAAAAGNFETLIFGRTLQGLGGGIFSPLVPLLLTRASPRQPGKMLIFWGGIAGYVAAFAPLLYGSVFGESDWHSAFVAMAVLVLFALVVLRGSHVAGDVIHGAGRIADYSELFRSRYLWVTLVYVFCTYGSITYFLFRLPFWFSSSDFEIEGIGFALSIFWLTFSGLSTLLRKVVDGPNLLAVMLAAPVLISAGFCLSYFGGGLFLLIVSAIFVGAGLACSNAPSTQLVLAFAPKRMKAASTSLDITFARL